MTIHSCKVFGEDWIKIFLFEFSKRSVDLVFVFRMLWQTKNIYSNLDHYWWLVLTQYHPLEMSKKIGIRQTLHSHSITVCQPPSKHIKPYWCIINFTVNYILYINQISVHWLLDFPQNYIQRNVQELTWI